MVNFADPNFFVSGFNIDNVFNFALFNSSSIIPFAQVNPSAEFSSDGIGSLFPANVGSTNGVSGPDFQFQVQSIASFESNVVPEPTSVAIFGFIGAISWVSFTRRRRK